MDAHVKKIVRAMSAESDAERIGFADVVTALMAAGVERYHADLVTSIKTYYMPDGTTEAVACHPVTPASPSFSAPGVEAAVRAIQAKTIRYREFCDRVAATGCVGYLVSLAGRRAVYYGRSGDSHVEWFPGAR